MDEECASPQEQPPAYNDEYYDQKAPPPPYYEAVGMQPAADSAGIGMPPEPALTYIDFLPDGEFSVYEDLVQKANAWLQANRQFKLQSCETVNFAVKNGMIDTNTSIYHDPAYGEKLYCRALRCWVVKQKDPSAAVQVLRALTRVPERTKASHCTITSTFTSGNGTVQCTRRTYGVVNIAMLMASMFEPFSKCLERLNKELEEAPLQGSILRIETMEMKVTEGMKPVDLNPDRLYWTRGDSFKVFAAALRVFYLEGEPAHETIGWRDIAPVFIPTSNRFSCKFEPFTQTLYKAGHWAFNQRDLRITNIQTLDTKVVPNVFFSGNGRPTLDTDRVDFHETAFGQHYQFVRFLRVCYVKSPGYATNEPYKLTQRPFLPYQTGYKSYETPSENIGRLGNWLSYNSAWCGINEDNVICAETIKYEHRLESKRPIDTEVTSYEHKPNMGRYYVTGVRLFMNGIYQEPPQYILGIPPIIESPSNSECCNIL